MVKNGCSQFGHETLKLKKINRCSTVEAVYNGHF